MFYRPMGLTETAQAKEDKAIEAIRTTRPILKEKALPICGGVAEYIEAKGWQTFVQEPPPANETMVREFYLSLRINKTGKATVRGVDVDFSPQTINQFFNLLDESGTPLLPDEYFAFKDKELDIKELVQTCGNASLRKKGLASDFKKLFQEDMHPTAKVWTNFVCVRLLPVSHTNDVPEFRLKLIYAICKGLTVDVGRVIHDNILDAAKTNKNLGLPHPHLITSLCLQAKVKGMKGKKPDKLVLPELPITVETPTTGSSTSKGKKKAPPELEEHIDDKFEEIHCRLDDIQDRQTIFLRDLDTKMDAFFQKMEANQEAFFRNWEAKHGPS